MTPEPAAALIHILGITSWIGFRLATELDRIRPGRSVGGTSRSGVSPAGLPAAAHAVEGAEAHRQLLNLLRPRIVVNLLRGEDANGLAVHETVLDWCGRHDALYAYASSVLALDGYQGEPLTEDLPARSITPYGQFKQACEVRILARPDCRHLILRFASIQGWVPHRTSRNEAFLGRLASGADVTVDRGVMQNRLLDRTFAAGVAALLEAGVTGVVHLGAVDHSEEFDFLRRVAVAFGFPADRVRSGATRRVNLVAVPGRAAALSGGPGPATEADTIKGLLAYEALLCHRFKAGGESLPARKQA